MSGLTLHRWTLDEATLSNCVIQAAGSGLPRRIVQAWTGDPISDDILADEPMWAAFTATGYPLIDDVPNAGTSGGSWYIYQYALLDWSLPYSSDIIYFGLPNVVTGYPTEGHPSTVIDGSLPFTYEWAEPNLVGQGMKYVGSTQNGTGGFIIASGDGGLDLSGVTTGGSFHCYFQFEDNIVGWRTMALTFDPSLLPDVPFRAYVNGTELTLAPGNLTWSWDTGYSFINDGPMQWGIVQGVAFRTGANFAICAEYQKVVSPARLATHYANVEVPGTATFSKTFTSPAVLRSLLVPGWLANSKNAQTTTESIAFTLSINGGAPTSVYPDAVINVDLVAGDVVTVEASLDQSAVIDPFIGGPSGEGPALLYSEQILEDTVAPPQDPSAEINEVPQPVAAEATSDIPPAPKAEAFTL